MVASPKTTKVSDRQSACKKLTAALKKSYTAKAPKNSLPVLETLLFASCLEDTDYAIAEAAYDRLLDSFHDLNEIRVSSVHEIEDIVSEVESPEWTAVRVRALLRHVFESTYQYDFERLKRLNRDQAERQLKRIDHISPFMISWVLQAQLGAHVVALDNAMLATAKWLHLVPPDNSVEQAAEFLKSGVKKADALEFGALLRSLATDTRYRGIFTDEAPEPDEPFEIEKVTDHLKDAQNPRRKKRVKKTVEKSAAKKKSSAKKKATAKAADTTTAAKKSPSAKKKVVASASSAAAGKSKTTKKADAKQATAKKKAAGKTTAPAKKSAKTTKSKKKK